MLGSYVLHHVTTSCFASQEVDVLQLAELGFPAAACRLALKTCGNSARAAEWLFDEGGGGVQRAMAPWEVQVMRLKRGFSVGRTE
eukprot:Skav235784  [mRNA]  locus=scaffold3426:97605:97859:- [translate_table: standard]